MAIPASPFGRYRASQLALSDGDPISTLTDEGSGGNDLSQTGVSRPAYESAGFNGHPSILFDGTDDFMQTAAYSATLSQPYTVIIMGEMVTVDPDGAEYLADGIGPSNRAALWWRGDSGDIFAMFNGTIANTTRAAVAGEHFCMVATFDDSASEFHYNDNGDEQPDSTGTDSLSGLTLNGRFDGVATTPPANARFVEILVYDRALTSNEITDLQDYFSATYAVATAEVTASIPLTLDVAAESAATHQATATVALALGIAPQAATQHSAIAAIPLALALEGVTTDPSIIPPIGPRTLRAIDSGHTLKAIR